MFRGIIQKLGFGAGSQKAGVSPPAPQPLSSPIVPPESGEDASQPVFKSRDIGLTDAVLAGWFNLDTAEVFEGFPVGPEDVVLDVGCGEGGATMFCATQGAHVVFTDMERDKVEDLERRVAASPARAYEALVCDTNPLPLPDGYASKILAMEMLEHTDDPGQILQELVRVGQPGALYLITVPDPVSEHLQRGLAPDDYFQAPNHVRIFERDEFEQTVKDAGLEVVRRGSWGFYWTMWMFFFWVTEAASGRPLDGAALDRVNPPYHPLLESWATTWNKLLAMPGHGDLKRKMDEFLPKAQLIIARKPA